MWNSSMPGLTAMPSRPAMRFITTPLAGDGDGQGAEHLAASPRAAATCSGGDVPVGEPAARGLDQVLGAAPRLRRAPASIRSANSSADSSSCSVCTSSGE